MVNLRDLLVDKSLRGLSTDRRNVIRSPVDFHDVIYHKWHCSVDNRRRNVVLQLLDVPNVSKNTRFSLNKSCGNFGQSVQDGGIAIDHEGFVHIFNLCVN